MKADYILWDDLDDEVKEYIKHFYYLQRGLREDVLGQVDSYENPVYPEYAKKAQDWLCELSEKLNQKGIKLEFPPLPERNPIYDGKGMGFINDFRPLTTCRVRFIRNGQVVQLPEEVKSNFSLNLFLGYYFEAPYR